MPKCWELRVEYKKKCADTKSVENFYEMAMEIHK